MLTTRLHTSPLAFDALAPEWDALASAMAPWRPFATPLWNQTWWRHFRRNDLRARDELRLFAMRDEAGTLVAVAPMMLSRRPGLPLVATRELQFLGADTNLTEIRGMAVQAGREVEALQALQACLRRRADWDWVQWRGLPAAVTEAVLPGFEPVRTLSDYYLDLPGSWDELRSRLPRNIKESLRKCYNSLKRDGHAFQLRVHETPAAVEAALATLFATHADRSTREDTIAHPDVFAPAAAKRFMVDIMTRCAASGRAVVFSLEIGGKAVATRAAFASGDELFLYYSGYDPAWGQYSVMTTTTAEAIQWAIRGGLRRVNLSTGSDVSKLRWRPEQVDFREGMQEAGTSRARLARAAVRSLRRRSQRPVF